MDMQGARSGLADYKSTTRDVKRLLDDFRQKNIDAVLIATPDHLHCTHLIAAVEAGKDVYVENGLTIVVQLSRHRGTQPDVATSTGR